MTVLCELMPALARLCAKCLPLLTGLDDANARTMQAMQRCGVGEKRRRLRAWYLTRTASPLHFHGSCAVRERQPREATMLLRSISSSAIHSLQQMKSL